MHEHGYWHTALGCMLDKYNESVLSGDITIIVDVEYGGLMKVGKKDWVTEYFAKLPKVDGLTDNWRLITFHIKNDALGFAPDGYNLDIDEVCTIINYFGNSIGNRMKWFLELPPDEIKAEIKRLQEIGF